MSTLSEHNMQNIILAADGSSLHILDQSLLPNQTRLIQMYSLADCHEAIVCLRVRGAPAIGIFAACALAFLLRQEAHTDSAALLVRCRCLRDALAAARPTAVNLSKMLDRCVALAERLCQNSVASITDALLNEALRIQREDADMCRAIAAHGLSLLRDGDSVITHCNAGPLATSQYGTALGPLLLGKEQGIKLHAFCDETRPLLQGARLTTYELQRAQVPCTLICDNMASIVMQQGKVQACLVGCDRVARNGDVANKIGTSGLAILAHYYGIPFYVLGPSSTIDFSCPDGAHIPIELRSEEEIKTQFFKTPAALPEIPCYNPAFDITPAALISAIITERGICRPPFSEHLARLYPAEFEEEIP